MEEIVFIKNNADNWKKIESVLQNDKYLDPDLLSDLYIQLTDDLSYAQTYFPDSKTCLYLNDLAVKIHQSIYQNKKEKTSHIVSFWTDSLPKVMRANRKEVFYSLIIFMISVLVGLVSSANDLDFIKLILGERYVNITVENINKDDPLAVYKIMNELDMFLGITISNIRVAFYAFVMGILCSFGTGWVLFQNGIMLGAFHYLFYKHGLLSQAMLTIWIHGTLEISAVILAGSAGIIMGNSILFPKTYTRYQSFQMGSKNGLKIIMGSLPLFIVAGFLEGFVTRYTDIPVFLSIGIILTSLCFVVWYYFIYPINKTQGV